MKLAAFSKSGRGAYQDAPPHYPRFLLAAAAVILCVSTLSACSTTGDSFRSAALSSMVPGRTTLAQASDLLGAAPVDTYAHGDGSVLARWAYKVSVVTDAIYARQELWLEFGPDGRFERVVRKVNVPSNPASSPAKEDTRVSLPATGASHPASAKPWGESMENTVIVYPLGSS
ncbi:MAG TPA: hypothetical protein VFR20_09045 [Burkholderiaceae bacterium]|nr:hypothetical protein [Burkholderiaceae bacterium]